MTDELRERLRRADPAGPPLDPDPSRPAPELLERTMSRPVLDAAAPSRDRRRLAAAAAVVLLVGGGAAYTLRAGDTAASGPAVSLALTGAGTSMASCAPFDVAFLRDMSPAFAGTVVSTDGGEVVLEVERWYAGGDADRVVLRQPDAASSAALDGVAFEPGQRYLVTAADGTVNGCGYSGPATPELEASFDEAF